MELKACAMGTTCSYSHEVNSYSYCGNALDEDDPKWVKGDDVRVRLFCAWAIHVSKTEN